MLDASTFLAGPHCATLFAEFGAEVIKIEMPGAGDSLRRLGKMVEGYSLWWRVEARNKKTATLDLRKPVGQDLFKRLVAISDVVVENFRPGTMEAWNLGWEQLREVNRGLVMVRISAFGQTGPLSKRPGFARIAHAFAGLTYLCGEPGRVPVMPGTASIADFLSGVYGASAWARPPKTPPPTTTTSARTGIGSPSPALMTPCSSASAGQWGARNWRSTPTTTPTPNGSPGAPRSTRSSRIGC